MTIRAPGSRVRSLVAIADCAGEDDLSFTGAQGLAVWVTANGRAWTTIDLPLPAGASGVLQQIAVHGEDVTALGTQTADGVTTPLADLSVNGGRTWRQVPLAAQGPDPAVTVLTADSGGFTAAVQTGVPGQQQVTIWTSTDGTSWTQSRFSGLSGGGTHQLTALAASGTVVTGIGSTATQLRQQPVILTLPTRS